MAETTSDDEIYSANHAIEIGEKQAKKLNMSFDEKTSVKIVPEKGENQSEITDMEANNKKSAPPVVEI